MLHRTQSVMVWLLGSVGCPVRVLHARPSCQDHVRVHDTMAYYDYTFPIFADGPKLRFSTRSSSSGPHVHLAPASMLWFASTSAEWNQDFSEVCRMEPTYQAIARLFRLPNTQ